MRIIRASEIGDYLYCQRAWWYATQGFEPVNQGELAGGNAFHKKHARLVFLSSCLQTISLLLLCIALILLMIFLLGITG